MKRCILLFVTFASIFLVFRGCKDPFVPDIPKTQQSILVVEGYINVGERAVTKIKLSRTTEVTESLLPQPEPGAQVSIEGSNDKLYPLTERQPGVYLTDSLDIPLEHSYRLRIKTSNGTFYSSEFSKPIETPPIDSVSWTWSQLGINIFLSTHDPGRKALYYQWDYDETWSLASEHLSFWVFKDGNLFSQDPAQRQLMRRCWRTEYSPDLITTSTVALAKDEVRLKEMKFIPMGDERLDEKYSIIIRQHALSKEAFEYLEIIKKNTRNVGSFTDPQPSQLFGNISSSNAGETAVGYIEAYTTSVARIFINAADLSYWNFSLQCKEAFVENNPDSLEKYLVIMRYLPTDYGSGLFPNVSVFAAPAPCVDCRLRGGSTVRPDFWN